jgi:hypothetical protein
MTLRCRLLHSCLLLAQSCSLDVTHSVAAAIGPRSDARRSARSRTQNVRTHAGPSLVLTVCRLHPQYDFKCLRFAPEQYTCLRYPCRGPSDAGMQSFGTTREWSVSFILFKNLPSTLICKERNSESFAGRRVSYFRNSVCGHQNVRFRKNAPAQPRCAWSRQCQLQFARGEPPVLLSTRFSFADRRWP